MRTMNKILAIVLVAAVVICCTACGGLDMSKVKGDWTLETADGKTVAELAESTGKDPASITMNATVTDDSFTLIGSTGTDTYKIQVKANGFECLDDSKNVVMGVIYDSAKDTLTFQMAKPDGSTMECVMKKGTADLTGSAGSTEEDGNTAGDGEAEGDNEAEGEYEEGDGEEAAE